MRKIGIFYAYWVTDWESDFFPFVKRAKDLGFEILELHAAVVQKLSRDDRLRIREDAERRNIELTFGMGLPKKYDVSSLDENTRTAGLRYMESVIEAVAEMGGTMIGGTVHSYWPATFPEDLESKEPVLEQSIRSMQELMPCASEHGVTLNVEILNRFEQFLVNDSHEGVDYMSRVNHKNCGILMDTFHMNIEEDSFAGAIKTIAPYMRSLHIGEPNRKPPGLGRLPWGEIKQALDDIDYEGPLVMEPFVLPGGQIGRDVGVWRPMIENPDLDALAARSCEFAKENLR